MFKKVIGSVAVYVALVVLGCGLFLAVCGAIAALTLVRDNRDTEE